MGSGPYSFGWAHHNNDEVAFHLHRVGMSLIKVENNSGNKRSGTESAGSHPAHSIRMDWNTPDVVVAGSVRKIEQNPVRMDRRRSRGFDRSTERDFDPQITLFSCRDDTLHPRTTRAVLCRRTGQQERQRRNMFLNHSHNFAETR
jgi:hypothetical protein